MTDPPDAVLITRLRPLLEADDPVPPEVVAAARAASTWRTIDEELAELADDSVGTPAGVRGGAARLLTYRAGDLTVELEVSTADGALRILGQVVPPQAMRVRIEQVGPAVEATADDLGRFRAGGLAPGPTRLVCTPVTPGGVPVHTQWTLL
jgi:hypothetical protein